MRLAWCEDLGPPGAVKEVLRVLRGPASPARVVSRCGGRGFRVRACACTRSTPSKGLVPPGVVKEGPIRPVESCRGWFFLGILF